MIQLKLNQTRKGRVWLDETPPATFTGKETHELEFTIKKTANATCSKPHSASIELLILVGSQPMYGFLGATFYPDETQKFIIQVLVGDSEVSNIKEFIATPPEILQVGLSQEYVSIILKRAAETYAEISPALSGKLVFNCAAHGVFSSNPVIFGFLSQTVIHTINLLCKEVASTEITKFIESAINSKPLTN
ncbi:MAG: hypothetical protein F6K30_22900 [Cyanothece sp. SIO2G6]|nr:hypothetical protein [Cyanothece sp. SIO2G6]